MARDRSRSRSRSRQRSRSRERSRSRDRRKRSRSRERRGDGDRRRSRSSDRDGDNKKAARLAKLQAWKAQQQQGQPGDGAGEAPPAPPQQSAALQEAVRRAQAAAAAAAAAPPPCDLQQDQLPTDHQQQPDLEEEVDPLDAFMAAEVMPEVQAKEQEERRAAAEERKKLAELLASGKVPRSLEDLIKDEEEEKPDMLIQLPANKVKLVIGAGGEKVKFIQRKTKCRIQHAKADDELVKGFGAGPLAGVAPAMPAAGEQRMVTLQLFGNADACEAARTLIMDAVDNREQKAKQRAREYEKKKEGKRMERQIYHMRHARDYEALGLPLGASKAEAKAAFRRLALKWHPDKNPDNREEAEARFQEISRAYESLMTTDEDARIEQLGS